MPTTATRKRRPRVKRYSNEWPASTKRFARSKHKTVDKSGNGAARRIDSRSTQTMGFAETRRVVTRRDFTHSAVTSLLRRIDNSKRTQPDWVKQVANNLREWLTMHTHLDMLIMSTLTQSELGYLDSIQSKRTR